MKLLEEIAGFPEPARMRLETQYHITTAEAFFEHAARNAAGLRKALRVSAVEFDRLVRLVEAHLPAGFADRCRQPAPQHPRGVIIKE
jgi:hypothetical protein